MREAIKASIQILGAFFIFFTLVMVVKFRPDLAHSPAEIYAMRLEVMTLLQCLAPATLICGISVAMGFICFPMGALLQTVVAPYFMKVLNARL